MPAPLRRRKLMGEINVVPYIDVMLVLLIIFMITAPLLKEGVKVDLPTAGAKPIDPSFLQKHEPLIVTVNARGRLYVNFGPNPAHPPGDARAGIRRPWCRPRRAGRRARRAGLIDVELRARELGTGPLLRVAARSS